MKRSARRAARAVLVVGAAALVAACGGQASAVGDSGSPRPSAPSAAPTLPPATQLLVDRAYARLATGSGDAAAKPQWEVRTTLGAVDDSTDPSHLSTPVVVAEGPGHFNTDLEAGPRGARLQSVRYLEVVVGADDGGVWGWSLGNRRQDLRGLGPLIAPRS